MHILDLLENPPGPAHCLIPWTSLCKIGHHKLECCTTDTPPEVQQVALRRWLFEIRRTGVDVWGVWERSAALDPSWNHGPPGPEPLQTRNYSLVLLIQLNLLSFDLLVNSCSELLRHEPANMMVLFMYVLTLDAKFSLLLIIDSGFVCVELQLIMNIVNYERGVTAKTCFLLLS